MYLHQGRHQGRKSKPLDDDGAKVRNPPVRDVAHHPQDEEEVELVVGKRLPDLVRLEMLILDAGLVLAQALDGHTAVLETEAGGSDGRVGEEDEHDDAPSGAEGAAAQSISRSPRIACEGATT